MSALSIAISRIAQALPPQEAAFYSSPEFKVRARLADPAAHDDKVKVLLALLKRVALHPELPKLNVDALAKGCVMLQFFHARSPVPAFDLLPGSPAHQQLTDAVTRNLQSPMTAAARAHLRWTGAEKRQRFQSFLVTRTDRFRHQLKWPSLTAVCARNPQSQQEYDAQHTACFRALDNHRTGVVARRNARIQRILEATGCGLSWFQNVAESVREAMPAPMHLH